MDNNKVTAVVLAGGGSARMGTNKALLKLGNKTMIERVVDPLKNIFNDILVVTNNPEEYGMLRGVSFVRDCINIGGKNSLIGLYSGLKQSKTSHIFVIGCDMPFINTGLIRYMVDLLRDEDILVPYVEEYYQPLHAIYGKACITGFENLLEKKQYKISNIYDHVNIKTVTDDHIKKFDPHMLCFENINTYEEYLKARDNFEQDFCLF